MTQEIKKQLINTLRINGYHCTEYDTTVQTETLTFFKADALMEKQTLTATIKCMRHIETLIDTVTLSTDRKTFELLFEGINDMTAMFGQCYYMEYDGNKKVANVVLSF